MFKKDNIIQALIRAIPMSFLLLLIPFMGKSRGFSWGFIIMSLIAFILFFLSWLYLGYKKKKRDEENNVK